MKTKKRVLTKKSFTKKFGTSIVSGVNHLTSVTTWLNRVIGIAIALLFSMLIFSFTQVTRNASQASNVQDIIATEYEWIISLYSNASEYKGVDYDAIYREKIANVHTTRIQDEEALTAYKTALALREQAVSIWDTQALGITDVAGLIGRFDTSITKTYNYFVERTEMWTGISQALVGVSAILIGLLALSSIVVRFIGNLLADMIRGPIDKLTDWSQQLALGRTDIDWGTDRCQFEDIEQVIDSCKFLVQNIEDNVNIISKVAAGDLTAYVNIHSHDDSLAKNVYRMVQTNDAMFSNISQIADSVAMGARDIAEASNSLAESCTKQIESLNQFKRTNDASTELINTNIEYIADSKRLSESIESEMVTGNACITELTKSMDAIKHASDRVATIIGTIEEIADQTNLLSLNASIEAARAGEAGRGFAVVASEVGSLANQCAKAAVESRQLIEDTLSKTKIGYDITTDTAKVFKNISSHIEDIGIITDKMHKSGEQQKEMIAALHKDITVIADAVDNSAAFSEETAASCTMLDSNAGELKDAMAQFSLRKREQGKAYIPPEKEDDAEFKEMAQRNYEQAVKEGRAIMC